MPSVLSDALLWSMIVGIFVLPVILRLYVGDEPRNSEPDEAEPERLPDLELRDEDSGPALMDEPGPALKAA